MTDHIRVAAIDIGSNSIRLLVGDVSAPEDGDFSLKTITRAGEPCRLARGLEESGLIDPGVARRAATVTAYLVARARNLGCRHTVIGATAALRGASNGPEVADLIASAAGLPIRVLSGEEEARIVYKAVVCGLGVAVKRHSCVVFDIGGGSTEVVSGVGAEAGRWVSLPFGAVTLTEKHFRSNPPLPGEIEALDSEVRSEIMHQCALLPVQSPVLAGVGGTVTVLALMDRGLEQYDPTFIEGWGIKRDRLEQHATRLLGSNLKERRSWPGMGEGRADIVAAGAIVVRALADRFPAPALLCSTQGLRYGLARLAAEEAFTGRAG